MKRIGTKPDKNWTWEELKGYKLKSNGTQGSRGARKNMKKIAKADKRTERQIAMKKAIDEI